MCMRMYLPAICIFIRPCYNFPISHLAFLPFDCYQTLHYIYLHKYYKRVHCASLRAYIKSVYFPIAFSWILFSFAALSLVLFIPKTVLVIKPIRRDLQLQKHKQWLLSNAWKVHIKLLCIEELSEWLKKWKKTGDVKFLWDYFWTTVLKVIIEN